MSLLRKKFSFVILILLVVFCGESSAFAANKKHNKSTQTHHQAPIQTSLVVDGQSGQILYAQNAKARIYPASLVKVMTIYMLFEALESGKVSLDQKLLVSKYATEAKPGKLYLKAGEMISVRDVILSLIVKSANDSARVASEALAGSEANFAKLMTRRAHQLGMKDTFFTNASGWHDPRQVTTPIDLAKLSIAIKRDFPQYYGFFSNTSFTFRGKRINGHNHVAANYPGAEGLKTGFTNPAGRNLITTATREGKSLVGIVTGASSGAARDRKMMNLLDQHFGVSTKPAVAYNNKKAKTKLVSYKKTQSKKRS